MKINLRVVGIIIVALGISNSSYSIEINNRPEPIIIDDIDDIDTLYNVLKLKTSGLRDLIAKEKRKLDDIKLNRGIWLLHPIEIKESLQKKEMKKHIESMYEFSCNEYKLHRNEFILINKAKKKDCFYLATGNPSPYFKKEEDIKNRILNKYVQLVEAIKKLPELMPDDEEFTQQKVEALKNQLAKYRQQQIKLIDLLIEENDIKIEGIEQGINM